MTETMAPLTPPEADLRDFAFTPMYRARLFGSAFHARATDAEWRAGVTLWLKSQDQVPAGSLPDDDVELCRLAELARDFKQWRKVKIGALRGWVKCSDGRLYHPVVAEITVEQWNGKIEQRKRTIKARIAALEKRLKDAATEPARQEIEATLLKLRQEHENMISALSQGAVTEDVTASKRERQGQGQRERQGQGDLKKDAGAAPPAAPAKEYAFEGQTIKLNQRDFDAWAKVYHGIGDLAAELTSIDAWWQGQQPEKRKTWFNATAGMLNKKHQAILAGAKNGTGGGFTPFQVGGL